MTSPDFTQANIDKIAELFPNVMTESLDADGNPERAVDFDLLRQELSGHIVEGPQERYRLDWPGKRAAAFAHTLFNDSRRYQPRVGRYVQNNAGKTRFRYRRILPCGRKSGNHNRSAVFKRKRAQRVF